MGIKLDWEIEAEQTHVKSAGEDPETRRRRRLARLRLLLFVLGVLAILGAIVGFIYLRLETVEYAVEELLRNTVDAEIAALRLGDWGAFSAAQRSASGEWLQKQEQTFQDYQALKLNSSVQLTGRILDLTIDRTRARVAVEEIINGVPYTRIWFYWRYDDGWRHVPPDYTFWGDVRRFDGQGVSVRFQAVDAPLAASLGPRLEQWLRIGCAALACGTLPAVMVDIVPDEGLQISWSGSNPWLLQVPSPYIRRARADMPFDLELQFSAAGLLAERLVLAATNNLQPVYPADAYHLRQAVISWLVGRFVEMNTNSFLIGSLAQNYGETAVGRLLQLMQPDSDARIFNEVAGVTSLEQASLDWRDLLTWRLVTEDELIRRRDEANFLALYDTRDAMVRELAYQRFAAAPLDLQKVVISAPLETGADGTPQIRAVVQAGDDPANRQEVLFRLVDGSWRRAS